MEYTSVLTTVTTALVMLWFYNHMAKGNGIGPLAKEDGKKELRINRLIYFTSLFSLAMAMVFLTIPFFIVTEQGLLVLLVVSMIMALFLGILGIFTLLEYKNACIRYDEKQVQVVNYKGNAKCFEWTDLNSVAVNGFTNRIVFRTKKGKVSCNQFMKGVNIFLVEAEAYSGISTAKALLQLNPFNSKTTR